MLLVSASCKKDAVPEPTVKIDNYITFKVDNTQVEARFKVILQDEVFNGYDHSAKYLEMQRLVANGNPQRLMIKIENIDLRTAVFPLVVKYNALGNAPSLAITYVDGNDIPFGSNTVNPDDFSLTINSYEKNVINCIFSGLLFSGLPTNPQVEITDGTLNLELLSY